VNANQIQFKVSMPEHVQFNSRCPCPNTYKTSSPPAPASSTSGCPTSGSKPNSPRAIPKQPRKDSPPHQPPALTARQPAPKAARRSSRRHFELKAELHPNAASTCPCSDKYKLCRSTSWPVWSVIQSKARWNNSVFCVTRRGVLLRPLNSNSLQTFRVGHTRSHITVVLK
jgi:hypothetical protein